MFRRSISRRLLKWACAGMGVSALVAVGLVPATNSGAAASKKPSGSAVVFHADLSTTGGGSVLGATEAKALEALEAEVNSTGGIHGHPMRVVIEDNNSTPTTSVALASKWVGQHVPFLLVGSLTATDRPVDALATSSGPFIYDLSPGDYPKPTTTVFDAGLSTFSDAQAYLTDLKESGLRRVAIINGTTASGSDGYTEFQKALKTRKLKLTGIKVTDHQTFTPTAPSVTTQMSAIKASNPQALVIWVTGPPVGTAFKAMSSLAMETIPTVVGNGNASFGLLTKLKTVLPKKIYFEGGPLYYTPKELHSFSGAVRSTVATFDKFVSRANGHVGDPWGLGYDPGLLLVGALKRLGIHATAKQILAYMEHLHRVAGVFGYYTTTPKTHRGTGYKDILIDTFNGTSFVPVSGPGGVLQK